MRRFNGRHLDEARLLIPRVYAVIPSLFGVDKQLDFFVPPDGDRVSMLVSREQHLLVCDYSLIRKPSSAGGLTRRYRTSPQTFSTVVTGQRWAGETLMVALSEAVRRGAGR